MRITVKQKTYYYLGFFLFIIIFAHYAGLLGFIENSTRSLLIPYINEMRGIASTNFPSSSSSTALNGSIDSVTIAKIKTLEAENDELKKLLNFRNSDSSKWITVAVLGKGLDNTASDLIISGGDRDGIRIGQPVVAGDGILVGKIIKTTDSVSIVRMVNDSRFNISARIINKDSSLGIVTGGYGLSLRMELIPRNEIVSVGDSVVTGGLETDCPRGLMVGTIAVVENEAYKPFQQAVLTPVIDLSDISAVSVLAVQ